LAIAHHPRVDDRLLLTLWHLAERWGRVRPEGIAVRLPLTHQRLADLVGAHRPSVTIAMGDLVRAGTVSRCEDGTWTLHGSPPPQLRPPSLGRSDDLTAVDPDTTSQTATLHTAATASTASSRETASAR